MLDEVDFQLLAHLIREPFASNEALGRVVSLSGPAVRSRLDRLRASGVLLGYRLLPSADALGRMHTMWTYRHVPRPPDVGRILDTDNVAWVVEWHDGSWTIHSFVAHGPSRPPPRA